MDLQLPIGGVDVTVYADVVFFANFISTFALLMAYGSVFGGKPRLLRASLASVASGVYAVFEQVLFLPYILRTAVLFLLIAIAFGRIGVLYNTVRFAFVTVCIEVLFMAVMSLTGRDALVARGGVTVFCNGVWGVAAYFLCYPVLLLVKKYVKMRVRKKYAEFVINGQKISLSLLYDSGNLLTYKGASVAVVAWDSIKDLFPDMDYDEFLITCEDRMIFNTVGRGGIIPVITPDSPSIDGSTVNIKIAVSQRSFNGYDGVVGDMKGMDKNAVYKKFCKTVYMYKE
ncbi:MAG: sigma-E processing peptidase SpoIIGA [Clostridia bacterium]|nr:sigma-E processing peptidase SpoIIGA [Clostridia bacterium]